MLLFLETCVMVLFVAMETDAFPSGAPVEACESLLPRHIHTSPKSAEESPYMFRASAGRFFPDSKRRKIKVQIKGATFKGFFIVALDADTYERIGNWTEANGMEPVPCSAVTHTDGMPKVAATMIWQPPPNVKKGEVLFLGTILESFSSYYSGLIAKIPSKKKKKILRSKNSTSVETLATTLA